MCVSWLCPQLLGSFDDALVIVMSPGAKSSTYPLSRFTLFFFAGDLVIERPATEVAAICQRLPVLWRQACNDMSHACVPRVILEPDLPDEVTVHLDGSSTTLPNIHRQLLLLTQLQPGKQRRSWGATFVFCPLIVVVVALVSYAVAFV